MSALPLMLLFLSAVALTFQSCKGKSKSNNISAATASLSDDALMDTVQRRTFLDFWEGAEPNSGLAPERYHVDGVYPEMCIRDRVYAEQVNGTWDGDGTWQQSIWRKHTNRVIHAKTLPYSTSCLLYTSRCV